MNPERAKWALWSVWVTLSIIAACQLDRPVLSTVGVVSTALAFMAAVVRL